MDIDKLIEVGRLHPEYANIIQDLERLRGLAETKGAENTLSILVEGLLREADKWEEEANPKLFPVGPADATTITTVDVQGAPVSVWQCLSFTKRLQFLREGLIAVVYPSNETIVPLCLRLDIEEMGIKVTS